MAKKKKSEIDKDIDKSTVWKKYQVDMKDYIKTAKESGTTFTPSQIAFISEMAEGVKAEDRKDVEMIGNYLRKGMMVCLEDGNCIAKHPKKEGFALFCTDDSLKNKGKVSVKNWNPPENTNFLLHKQTEPLKSSKIKITSSPKIQKTIKNLSDDYDVIEPYLRKTYGKVMMDVAKDDYASAFGESPYTLDGKTFKRRFRNFIQQYPTYKEMNDRMDKDNKKYSKSKIKESGRIKYIKQRIKDIWNAPDLEARKTLWEIARHRHHREPPSVYVTLKIREKLDKKKKT